MTIHKAIIGTLIPIALAACATIPRSVEQGYLEIKEVRRAIECDLAAIAMTPSLAFTNEWEAKSSLDLSLTLTAGVDGKINWVIPHLPAPTFNVDPTLGIEGQNKSIAHLDFVTDIPTAVLNFEKNNCVVGPDPSGVGLGLAAWFASTLSAVEKKNHGGMSFTSEFVVEAKAGTRFGYQITRLGVDAGPNVSRLHSNRFTVAVSPPAGRKAPTEVIIVGGKRQTLPRALENFNLDRLLLRQAPLNLPAERLR